MKKIYYYFKLKKMLELFEILPFFEYLLKGKSLFRYCMTHHCVAGWMHGIGTSGYEKSKAYEYAQDEKAANVLIRKYHRAQDFWRKNYTIY